MNNNNTDCISCQLPVKEYKQNTQEREDLCENCYIADSTDYLSEDSTED
jgi:hypothetical protein